MEINIKTYKPFVSAMNNMKNKYGEKFEYYNGFHESQLSLTEFIDNFIDTDTVADATIDPNANSATKDIRTLMNDMMKPIQKLLCFNKIFYEMTKFYGIDIANKWLENEWNGLYYLHNASTSTFLPYCYAYDLDGIVEKGLYFLDNFGANPAKHLTTFNNHVLEFVSWVSNRSSGAVGLPSYLIYSFWFWKKDVENGYFLKSPEYYRDQSFQEVIYNLNQPYLRITESTFSNFTIMDREYLKEIFGGREYPDGTFVIDYIDDIIEYQKAFMNVVSKVRYERMMTFPVLTFSLLFKNGKFVDEDFAKWCVKHNMEWNDSNFYVGNDVTSLSSCCRLISNIDEMNKAKKAKGFINSIGGTSLQVGSTQVNTINLARIAKMVECYDIDNIDDKISKYLDMLTEYQELSMKLLHVIRHIIKRNIEKGLLPNYTSKLVQLENQFMTQGITAIYEAVREFNLITEDEFGNKNYSDKGYEFAGKILDTIQKNIEKFTEDKDYSINIENVPGESANAKLCNKDHDLFSTDLYKVLFDGYDKLNK